MAHDETVFEPDAAWTRALEKYGAATHLAVELYGRDERLILGPVHPTRLFELLAPADQAKDDFLAMLSHELRNPLGAIQLAAQIIRLGRASQAAIQKATEIVDRQVKHVARLLDDLLDVSRITRGRIELRKSSVPLATSVAHAVGTSRALIEAQGHSLTISLPEEPILLEVDPTRLE